jgi:hypothetical protein
LGSIVSPKETLMELGIEGMLLERRDAIGEVVIDDT